MRKLFLFFASLFLAHGQVCVPVPTPGTTITQSTLDEVRKRGALAPGVSAFASLEAYAVASGGALLYLPESATDNKFWADFTPGNAYLTIDGSLDTSDPATWSDQSMVVYGRTVVQFYQDRAKAKDAIFRYIPKFKVFYVTQQAEMNMRTGIGKPGPRLVTRNETPYPLARLLDDPVGPVEGGKRWSWPTNHLLRFNPDSGNPEACDYQEYSRAFPIVTTVSVGNAAGTIRLRGMTSEVFLSAVAAALFGPGSPAERVAKILGNLEVQ